MPLPSATPPPTATATGTPPPTSPTLPADASAVAHGPHDADPAPAHGDPQAAHRDCVTATPVSPSATAAPPVTATATALLPNGHATARHRRAPTPTATLCTLPFADVPENTYYTGPVQYLYCRSIISGYADNTFRPFNETTRATTKIVMAALLACSPRRPRRSADVTATHPFYG